VCTPPCSITGPDPVTFSSTGNLYSGPAGMAVYGWSIAGNGTIVGAVNGQTVSVTAGSTAGTFTLTLNIRDSNGCTNQCQKIVTVTPPPCIPQPCFIDGNTIICQGQTTVLRGPDGKIQYRWEGPNGYRDSHQTIVVGVPGLYTLYDISGNGCSNSCSVTLVANLPPPCSITGNLLITNGLPTTLCGPLGAAQYLWTGPQNNGAGTQCITVSNPGTYTLKVIGANGCETNCSVTVVDRTPQPCTIDGNTTVCQGSTTLLRAANGMLQYLWTGPEQNGATTQFIIVGTQGLYTVRQVDGRGLTNSCSVMLTVNNAPPCDIQGALNIRPGRTTTLIAPDGLLSQYWLGPQNNGLNTRSNTVSVAGAYTLVMRGSNGCERACSVRVTLIP
jgi:hypothetical protein